LKDKIELAVFKNEEYSYFNDVEYEYINEFKNKKMKNRNIKK